MAVIVLIFKDSSGWLYPRQQKEQGSPINTKYLTVAKTVSVETKFEPYKVKVNADALNIRKGAGTNYAIAGTIKNKGVYTIVAESDGKGASKWGKLKSGAGWISLDYADKV